MKKTMLCQFNEKNVCRLCGRRAKCTGRVLARCRHIPCRQRGPKKRPVKVECCGNRNAFVPSYACERHRLCILDGTISQEPERSLIKVCSTCPDRQSA